LLVHVFTEDKKIGKVELAENEGVFSRFSIAHATGLTESATRWALDTLVNKDLIVRTVSNYGRFTIIKINSQTSAQNQPNKQPTLQPSEELEPARENEEFAPNAQPTQQPVISPNSPPLNKKEKKNNINIVQSELAQGADSLELKGRKKTLKGKQAEAFKQFWNTFSDKRNKARAIDSWHSIPEQSYEHIFYSAKKYAQERDELIRNGRTPKMAEGWLADRRWEDYEMPKPQTISQVKKEEAKKEEYTEETRQRAIAYNNAFQEYKKQGMAIPEIIKLLADEKKWH